MNCNQARQHWNLYHDSEGDAELHFQISEHLAMCPDCAEWFGRQSRLESLLAENLNSQTPTPELWNQVLSRSGLIRPAPGRRRFWMAGIAACAAVLVVAVLWNWKQFSVQSAPDLVKLTAARHERLAAGEEIPQFESRSDLEVEDYLKKRVTFPVRCPPRKDAGFAVQGAGVCRLAEQPAAYLSGRVDEAPVSIFVLPRESLAAFPRERDELLNSKSYVRREGRDAMVMGIIDQNAVLVIGQTSADRLEKVLRAYGTYPDHP